VSVAERTDEELLTALCQGEDAALAVLVGRYQNDILRFCVHYLKDVERAKDIAQETFLRVFVARERFDERRKFRPWVLCIARNLCLNELKRKRTVPMESLDAYSTRVRGRPGQVPGSNLDGPDEAAMAAERQAALEQALDTLDEESREVVILRFFERMSARDIAEIVGTTEGAIRTRLHRILRTLRSACTEQRENL